MCVVCVHFYLSLVENHSHLVAFRVRKRSHVTVDQSDLSFHLERTMRLPWKTRDPTVGVAARTCADKAVYLRKRGAAAMATNGGMSSSSGKNLLEGYHRIAAETLLGST